MTNTIPFMDVLALRRFRAFQDETGLAIGEIRRLDYWRDFDWTRGVILLPGREIALSERAREMIHEQYMTRGELWPEKR